MFILMEHNPWTKPLHFPCRHAQHNHWLTWVASRDKNNVRILDRYLQFHTDLCSLVGTINPGGSQSFPVAFRISHTSITKIAIAFSGYNFTDNLYVRFEATVTNPVSGSSTSIGIKNTDTNSDFHIYSLQYTLIIIDSNAKNYFEVKSQGMSSH